MNFVSVSTNVTAALVTIKTVTERKQRLYNQNKQIVFTQCWLQTVFQIHQSIFSCSQIFQCIYVCSIMTCLGTFCGRKSFRESFLFYSSIIYWRVVGNTKYKNAACVLYSSMIMMGCLKLTSDLQELTGRERGGSLSSLQID